MQTLPMGILDEPLVMTYKQERTDRPGKQEECQMLIERDTDLYHDTKNFLKDKEKGHINEDGFVELTEKGINYFLKRANLRGYVIEKTGLGKNGFAAVKMDQLVYEEDSPVTPETHYQIKYNEKGKVVSRTHIINVNKDMIMRDSSTRQMLGEVVSEWGNNIELQKEDFSTLTRILMDIVDNSKDYRIEHSNSGEWELVRITPWYNSNDLQDMLVSSENIPDALKTNPQENHAAFQDHTHGEITSLLDIFENHLRKELKPAGDDPVCNSKYFLANYFGLDKNKNN